ncbi:MAG: hypothetical protein ACOX05_01650 [Bacillota bacterium]|jgi:hypothetical protein
MKKISKILIISLSLAVTMSLLIGCGNTTTGEPKTQQTAENEVDLATNYDINVREILVKYKGKDGFLKNGFEITDSTEVQQMIESVNFDFWKKAEADEILRGVPYYWVQFGDKTTIAIYYDRSYGRIGVGLPDESGLLIDVPDGDYNIPQEFYDTLLEFVEKYKPELLSE